SVADIAAGQHHRIMTVGGRCKTLISCSADRAVIIIAVHPLVGGIRFGGNERAVVFGDAQVKGNFGNRQIRNYGTVAAVCRMGYISIRAGFGLGLAIDGIAVSLSDGLRVVHLIRRVYRQHGSNDTVASVRGLHGIGISTGGGVSIPVDGIAVSL